MGATPASTLTLQSPLSKRLWAWVLERFPPANLLLFATLYANALLYGRHLALPAGAELPVMARDLAGLVAAVAFFLLLRVFDEHKDYALDLQNHPQRILQSGLIKLSHLKVIGAVCLVIQLAASLWQDHAAGKTLGPATQTWLVVIGWSTLMAKEFFIGEWLSKRLVLYAVSHMVVMPMALVWMAQLGIPFMRVPTGIAIMATLSFLSGFAFEITRKTWAPAEERDTVDSYSKILGVRGAALLVMLLCVGQAVVLAILLRRVFPAGVHPAWYLAVAMLVVLPALTLSAFVRAPSKRGSKRNEAAVGLAMMIAYGLLIGALLSARGVRWP